MQTLLYIKGVSIKRQESGRPAVYGPGGSRTRVRSSLVTKTSTRLSHLLYLAWTAGRAEQSHAELKEVLFLIFLKAYVLSEAAACLDHTVTAAIPYGLVSYETLTDKKSGSESVLAIVVVCILLESFTGLSGLACCQGFQPSVETFTGPCTGYIVVNSPPLPELSGKVDISCKWTTGDSNPEPSGYEPPALTSWANGP